ncbi:TIGR03767 family metallophosphoesterase [Arthrobacter sp. NicSoilC12]|uniref:TIGR03767 family metallophosphoesterase n=1 Tax=Arthrobacter sp. NicSoilC12 TaxID=2831001 RepID=UPI001CC41E19|nr:TIGR03767 family metallophosphoesterase [Arthrobacter sp. NicSoilC12]
MQLSRRDAIRWAATAAIGTTVLALSESTGVLPPDAPGTLPAKPDLAVPLTTLDATATFGPLRVQNLPYRRLSWGPAARPVLREELSTRKSTLDTHRKALATFGHLTDAHVLDAANPGRLTFLWQYYDFSDKFPSSTRFRPQDLFTVHVLDATIRKLNAVRRGPICKRSLDCLVTTGDLTNAYAVSELSAAIGVFEGRRVTSHPGGGYQGVQDDGPAPLDLSKSIWHPEPETSLLPPDDWKTLHGYPTVPGLLEAAVEPIAAEGAKFPWYIGFGNHDESGRSFVSPKNEFVDALRVGNRLPIRLPHGMDTSEFWNIVDGASGSERRSLIESMRSRPVRSSTLRRPFSKAEFVNALTANAAQPHSRSDLGGSSSIAPYYTFDISPDVMGIMLNTASPDGTIRAVLDASQAEWLEDQLRRVSQSYYSAKGKLTKSDAKDRLVMLFSHHPLSSFEKGEPSSASGAQPLNRPAVLELISRFPNVVAWMNGHIHRHRVTPHKPKYETGGFWEITTASLIDYPQQSRIIELLDNGDGTLSIAATLVDHSSPESVIHEGPQTAPSLAALSLELSGNRPGIDRGRMLGRDIDQNVDLIVLKPF